MMQINEKCPVCFLQCYYCGGIILENIAAPLLCRK
jgi:hypothetical protein